VGGTSLIHNHSRQYITKVTAPPLQPFVSLVLLELGGGLDSKVETAKPQDHVSLVSRNALSTPRLGGRLSTFQTSLYLLLHRWSMTTIYFIPIACPSAPVGLDINSCPLVVTEATARSFDISSVLARQGYLCIELYNSRWCFWSPISMSHLTSFHSLPMKFEPQQELMWKQSGTSDGLPHHADPHGTLFGYPVVSTISKESWNFEWH
jgi:hypothetical protein